MGNEKTTEYKSTKTLSIMRDFFHQCFKDLRPMTGLLQYIEIITHPGGKEKAQELLDELITPMLEASEEFKYIPIPDQQKIIRRGIVTTDRKFFYHLDAYIVRKWLQDKAHLYFKEEAHKQGNESNAVPVTYDQLKPETKQLVDELLNSLSLAMKVPKLTAEQIQEEGQEQLTPRATVGHIPTETDLQVLRRAEIIERLGYNKLSPKEVKDMEMFTIGTHEIRARNREEAEQIALAVYE